MNTKYLWASKTFWANIAGWALAHYGVLPPKYGVVVMVAANVLLRLMTYQPVRLFPDQ